MKKIEDAALAFAKQINKMNISLNSVQLKTLCKDYSDSYLPMNKDELQNFIREVEHNVTTKQTRYVA